MKTYYMEIDDCQGNVLAVVKVEANDYAEAKKKAILALHRDDVVFDISAKDAKGYTVIDEDGCEVEVEE